ncbi:hypothetical protein [Rhizobium mesoamericanum]|uniref:hypothetical protein n=1 Tax=Rhizobium mesoamericanum TaxID=1079800 RepID=UPI0009DBC7B4|nr:hypothetical protein [Rhizobium mesoamericanum]
MTRPIPAAGEAMSCSRRSLLSALPGLAAATAIPAVLDGPRTASAASDHPAASVRIQENPDLLRAYDRLLAARAEAAAAEDALEWLADEWKHLWPLAPEELLRGANAQYEVNWKPSAERDIIGRYLVRDTSVLTTRMSRAHRQESPQTCFSVLNSSEALETLDDWKRHVPKGRTEKSLASNRAFKEKAIEEFERKLALAEKYEAETDHLRRIAGVDDARNRVATARGNLHRAEHDVSLIPAFALEGLRIKAEAIKASDIPDTLLAHDSPLGNMARILQSILDVAERTSA